MNYDFIQVIYFLQCGFMFLVLDIGGTSIKYALMDQKAVILKKGKEKTNNISSKEDFLDLIYSIYIQYKQVSGIALSVPGVVDTKNGIVEMIASYPFLKNVCLVDEVSKKCDGLKVTLENDARCAGLAEIWIGNASHVNDAVVIVFGTGIGSTVIKNRKIHQGFNKLSGEISTLITHYNYVTKELLTWSDIASVKSLCQKVEKLKRLKVGSVTGEMIFEWESQGDIIVKEILNEFYFDIAVQLYNIQYVYDPEVILIGGGISIQTRVLDGIKKALDQINQLKPQIVKVNINVCKFYNDANLIGALYYFLNKK